MKKPLRSGVQLPPSLWLLDKSSSVIPLNPPSKGDMGAHYEIEHSILLKGPVSQAEDLLYRKQGFQGQAFYSGAAEQDDENKRLANRPRNSKSVTNIQSEWTRSVKPGTAAERRHRDINIG
ncbi:MAG: hypothetical protein U5K69_01125 [Balneolaceae bacterium]|nr:hypothetical protein [Balneolaceae bacterium]